MHFFCQKICAYQKKAVLLQAFSSEMARLIGKALAQMAESVDALVSNTSGAIRAGSTPALGTSRELRRSAFALRTEAPYSRSFSPKGKKQLIVES